MDTWDDPAFQRPRLSCMPDGLHLFLRGLQPCTLHAVPEGAVVMLGRERVFMDDACQQLRLERGLHGASPSLDRPDGSKDATTGSDAGPVLGSRSGCPSGLGLGTGFSETSGSRP